MQYVIRECRNKEFTNETGWPFCTSWQNVLGNTDLTENGNTPPPEELMIDYDNVKKIIFNIEIFSILVFRRCNR